MAFNQRDPNDKLLPLEGMDVVSNEDISIQMANGAQLDINGLVLVNGVPFGSGGGIVGYVHTQGSAATTWTINHNLGYKPVVQVYNAGSLQMIAEIEDVTINQTIVRVSPAQSGFARLL
jgi:hypothetical protein